ncbi:MucR family transcriptional regulator [Desulfohalobium retbaense]|uniref:Transcriptional regulator, MucR family n=1 Tax=Desulfohalobium retbaense (strain ATCC 49708 / DSM 5692 / JCM 16813 / HR100) TaxID=485915 RepID=C8X1A2_DESRD|nr:MucR family transcriptional regulator [Desulfohalobium retbaense]ACV68199.1 transcriptional regulator, MucR family [Desulfohalobium retbaense DSM 5692]
MEDYMKQALEIVKAQAGVRNMSEEEITSMVQALSQKLKNLEEGTQEQEEQQEQQPAVDPKKAIREKSVICLECGKQFKVLTKKHLATHGLTPAEYKEKWGFKKTQALIAKSLARERKKKMQEMQLWERRKKKSGGDQ